MKEPITINRNAVLIIPKQGYYDWANAVFPEDPIDEEDFTEFNTYLISENSSLEDSKEALDNFWEFIFENELFEISTEDEDWPEELTWELFTQFFKFHFSSIVVDLDINPFYVES
jgi:hypothetical protein